MCFALLTHQWLTHVHHLQHKDDPERTRMWANAQRDGRPAEYRWRPLFNAAKFCWRRLLECRAVTLHISMSISSATFTCSSKLMVDSDSTHLVYNLSEPDFRLSFYESYHESSNFAECRYFTTFKRPYFRIAWRYTVRSLGVLVVLQVPCMLIWPWLDPRSRSRS